MFHRQGCGLTPLSVPVMVRVLRVNLKFQPMRQIPWGQVPQSAVGSLPIVVSSPGFHLLGSVLRGQEPVLVQALLTEASVERLNEGVVRGLPGPAEVQLHPVQAGPLFSRCASGRRCCPASAWGLPAYAPWVSAGPFPGLPRQSVPKDGPVSPLSSLTPRPFPLSTTISCLTHLDPDGGSSMRSAHHDLG